MAKLPCPTELWPEFSALLDEALEIPERERPTWLASLGTKHAAVRPWVVKVMASNPGTLEIDFMKAPVMDEPEASEFLQGQHVGPYLLKQRLGSGGMGEVWLASRSDGTLNRKVALKLPHTYLLAGAVRRRFERERDILAALSHPHIAQLYDAGVADSNPYLAMELVDGVSINEHCQHTKLSLDGRLDLFLQILEAVGYAHERLIAHRDLKPSNILVTRDENVKLLDFGIAKLLTGDTGSGETQLTRIGHCIATPGYAAPEQLAGAPITVAVDLYALGVVLHELLTSQRPVRDLRKASSVKGNETPRASTRIQSGHAGTVGGLNDRQLRRALTGDLDAIIAKALEADPARRYRSAEAFAQDLERSRQHLPISARRISPTTLTLKFVRRHVLGVSMTCLLLLVLIGGSAGIAWQAVRAEREAQRATATKDFLIGMFRASDPRIAADKPRGEITARQLLDVSTKQLETSFANQPATLIELLGVTADIYSELDETQRSTALYARETELANKYFGPADVHAIDGLIGQANNADADGNDARTLSLLATADPLIRQALLDKSVLRARWLLLRGEALMDDAVKGDDARASLEAAAALFKTVAPLDPRYPDALTDLGGLSLDRSQFSLAASYFRHTIAVAEPNPQLRGDLLFAYAGLALALKYLGDFSGAAAAFERGADIAARTYGRDSQKYRVVSANWAQFRYERGERRAALAAFETLWQGLPVVRSAYRDGTDAFEAAQVLRKYGYCLAIDGQGARSIQLLEQAQNLLEKSASRAFAAGWLQLDLGTAYAAGGRIADARKALSAGLVMWGEERAPPSKLALALERWGRFLLAQREATGAEAAFNQALRVSAGHLSESAVSAQAGLAAIAVSRGNAHAALEASGRAMDQLDYIEGGYDVRTQPYVWGIRARALLLAGEDEAARALAKRMRDTASLYYVPGSTEVAEADALVQNSPTRATFR
jgi:serine/threonine protein kinase